MIDDDLPELRMPPQPYVENYVREVFGHSLVHLEPIENDAFRVMFDFQYFHIPEDRDRPSKSQWSTLKKRMKRVNKGVFVFKEHGEQLYEDEPRAYVDFGFFAD